jgi:hypothetical protein
MVSPQDYFFYDKPWGRAFQGVGGLHTPVYQLHEFVNDGVGYYNEDYPVPLRNIPKQIPEGISEV